VTPDLLFHPVLNEAKALAGVSDGEVIHPTPQYRVDQLDHPIHRLGLESPKHLLEFAQQRRAFLHLRRIVRSESFSAREIIFLRSAAPLL
jgi:hypothetical protein